MKLSFLFKAISFHRSVKINVDDTYKPLPHECQTSEIFYLKNQFVFFLCDKNTVWSQNIHRENHWRSSFQTREQVAF